MSDAFVERYIWVGRASSSASLLSMSGSWPFVTRNMDLVAFRVFRYLISCGSLGYIVGSPESEMA